MRFLRTLTALGLVLIVAVAQADPKKPSEQEVRMIFNQGFGQSLLFYMPHKLPIEIERIHKSLEKKLDIWVNLGLLNKKNTRFLAEKMMYGEPREVSVGGYKYELNHDNAWVSEKGIFYGRPEMASLFEVSPVSHIGSHFVCEVYLSWYVEDVPDWLNKVDLSGREFRQLRRAQESQERPFEKRLYLIHQDNRWALWKEKGEQSLFAR